MARFCETKTSPFSAGNSNRGTIQVLRKPYPVQSASARARQTSLQLDVHLRGGRQRGGGAAADRPAFSAKNARDIRKQRERTERERERETHTKAMNSARRRPGTDRERERGRGGQRVSGRGQERPASLCTVPIKILAKASFLSTKEKRQTGYSIYGQSEIEELFAHFG